jgi:hypothetical protein
MYTESIYKLSLLWNICLFYCYILLSQVNGIIHHSELFYSLVLRNIYSRIRINLWSSLVKSQVGCRFLRLPHFSIISLSLSEPQTVSCEWATWSTFVWFYVAPRCKYAEHIAAIMSFSLFWATQVPSVSHLNHCQLPEQIQSLKAYMQYTMKPLAIMF